MELQKSYCWCVRWVIEAVPYENVVVVALFGAAEEEWMYFEMLPQFVLIDHLKHQQIETGILIASVCSVPQPAVVVVVAAAVVAAEQLTRIFSN